MKNSPWNLLIISGIPGKGMEENLDGGGVLGIEMTALDKLNQSKALLSLARLFYRDRICE